MSSSDKPVRRRRIAGESSAATPAAPTTPKRPVVKKPVARRPVTPPVEPPVVEQVAPARRTRPATAQSAKSAKSAQSAKSAKPAESIEPAEPAARKQPKDRSGGPTRRDLLLVVPLALVAIVSLVFGTRVLVNGLGGDDDIAGAHAKASAAAGAAAETIFSFSYDKLDDHLATSKAIMTPAFAKDFEKIAPALTELAPQRKIVVKAVAREAAAQACGKDCAADKAEVLVFVDQARLVGDSKQPTVFANRIKISMVRTDGSWLVSDIRAL